MPEMVLKPIGIVRSEVKDPARRDWQEVVSEIMVDPGLEECLDGLEEFSHIMVVYWMHRAPSRVQLQGKLHPRGRADPPLVGLFATRSPHRPNPLGVSVAKLLERKGQVLKVEGLDAIDGTPVIDIKPYMPPRSVSPEELHMPDWVQRLSERDH